MALIFILGLQLTGLVVTSALTDASQTEPWLSTVSKEFNNPSSMETTPTISASIDADMTSSTNTYDISSISSTTSNVNLKSTIIPTTTKQKRDETPKGATTSLTTPKPIGPSKTTAASTSSTSSTSTTPKPRTAGSASTGIVILVLIIIVALGFGVACLIARKRQRRYSVDFTSRPDEVNIPLSTVEPEFAADTSPNGLQTFESAETTTKEPEEPEAKPDVQEEKKSEAEADKSAVEPSAESAAPAPSPDSSEDKPKEDVVEQSPPAPVQPSAEEKTDDEGAVSTKTSVESLKETNENNSNNADCSQRRDLDFYNTFWDVPLHCPV